VTTATSIATHYEQFLRLLTSDTPDPARTPAVTRSAPATANGSIPRAEHRRSC
jgi:hypothetical protein